jgi:bacterioferritin
MGQFTRDLEDIRRRAERKLEEGAVTGAYRGDVHKTISILNEALATEIVCVLRYMHHYFMATGVHAKAVAGEFKEHADAEREHADHIAERIQQLGGKPDFDPRSLMERSASQYIEGESLADMIREDLIAERIVIEVYNQMIRYFGNNDPTSRLMMEHILKDEEEHASDLADLLYVVDPATGETKGEDPGTRALAFAGRQQGEPTRQHNSGRRNPPKQHGPQPPRPEPKPFVPAFANPEEAVRLAGVQQSGQKAGGRQPRPLPHQAPPPAGNATPSPETQARQQQETFAGRGSAGPDEPERSRRRRRSGRAA